MLSTGAIAQFSSYAAGAGLTRRRLLATAAALATGATGVVLVPSASAAPLLGDKATFSWISLIEEARRLAEKAYFPPSDVLPTAISEITYDHYRAIRFLPRESLWRGLDLPFEVQFFHPGSIFTEPVHVMETMDGEAREVLYAPELFDLGGIGLGDIPDDLGFAGFRLHHNLNSPDYKDELVAFLGASYFRAVGRGALYGLSARGIAVDTATDRGEEFPAFRRFWLEQPRPGAAETTIYALLDGPSLAGAYAFVIRPGDVTVMDVRARLFCRAEVEKIGIAPLTSMYLLGPADRGRFDDFRPAVHDSDGLSMWTGAGEFIWRPLANPERLQISGFQDENPRGFGLLQRSRDFSSFQDLEAHYERRPSLWVEPLAGWGRGSVELIEIPVEHEIHDNIVAFWRPDSPPGPGTELELNYRLHWGLEVPFVTERGRVVATMTGAGGTSGSSGGLDSRKFVIDFKGGPLDGLAFDAGVEAVTTASAGVVVHPVAQPNAEIGGWRAFFDLAPDGVEPSDLRCFLRLGAEALTETWSYRWTP